MIGCGRESQINKKAAATISNRHCSISFLRLFWILVSVLFNYYINCIDEPCA